MGGGSQSRSIRDSLAVYLLKSADHHGCADRDVDDAPSSFCCSRLLLAVVCVGVVLIGLALEVPLSLFCGPPTHS
jgi:hypothetical protein